jgi:hypothetical protein
MVAITVPFQDCPHPLPQYPLPYVLARAWKKPPVAARIMFFASSRAFSYGAIAHITTIPPCRTT